MNFMDVLLKKSDASILKAATVLDLILERLNKNDWTQLGMDRDDLKDILTGAAEAVNIGGRKRGEWGKVDETPKKKPDWSDMHDLREGEEEEYGALEGEALFDDSGKLKSMNYILKAENAMILWTRKRVNENRPYRDEQTKVEPSFMRDALLQLKEPLKGSHPDLISTLVKLISDKERTSYRDISAEQDPYTKTGKKGGAEVRHMKPQEHVLMELLDKIENKENFQDNIRLKNRLLEEKVLTMNFLARVSSDLTENTSYVHPRIISKLENATVLGEFKGFLHSMGRGWPTKQNLGAARRRLAEKGKGTQLVDILIDSPRKFVFQEGIYEKQMDRLNKWMDESIDEWDEFLDDFNVDGEELSWVNIETAIRERYNSKSDVARRNVSYEDYEGKKLVKFTMRAMEIMEDIERLQTAKERLKTIVEENEFNIELDDAKYDDANNSYIELKKTYNFNKYSDEAARTLSAKKETEPTKKPEWKKQGEMLEGRLSPQFPKPGEDTPKRYSKDADPNMLIQMHKKMKTMIPQLEEEIREAEAANYPVGESKKKLNQISRDLDNMEAKFADELNLEEEE